MIELGCKNKIPGSSCEKKWKELCAQPLNTQLQHIQGPNSAGTSPSSAQSCDMKRRFSQLSEDEDGFGLED